MAINRVDHPITDDEIVDFLECEAKRLEQDVEETKRIGDIRPELLKAAAERIKEIAAKE